VKTQYITKVVKEMKNEYAEMYKKYRSNIPMSTTASKSGHF